MKILCTFGKYQYGNPDRGIGTEYAAFVSALKRLDHQVIHFDSWDKTIFSNYAELNQSLLKIVEQERPDVMLTVQRNYEIWLETLKIIQARGDVATISWTTDDSWKYQEVSRFIGTAYHAMTTTYAEVVDKYNKDGIPNVLLTQWAANPEILQEPIPAELCHYQVSFVGAAHGDRKQRITELKSKGIEVTCFGHGWPNGSIAAEEIPRIMRESIISLNFANAYKGVNQVKARNFEVPGAGGFLLTEYAPGLERAYIDNKEISVFYSTEELAEKIQYFLANLAERDAITQTGFYRTKQEHIYDIRIQEILNFALESHAKWKINNPKYHTISFEKAFEEHTLNSGLQFLQTFLIFLCFLIWGRKRCLQAARRLMFEISWRFLGDKTFMASGWVGRMFPYV
ncbi:CgeB family protein [Anabaena sp. UHCC 0399]|uniref:CgeB family protein n=1 Tax=Anabaena sp. UHCC 0399 TaxID=3110238 RepID=UPI002B209250|nr:glycosyltransferase [Anabaena sp. UHCC 0399]MEA5566419.1 glycosyltransferase [Anabaena sp. UHCC 0399]